MKILAILVALFCFGCVSAPQRPNDFYLYDEIKAGRMNADGVNKAYDDYYAAMKEYEQTASYKSIPYLLFPLLLLGGAANGLPTCGYRGSGYGCGYRGYHGYGGKTVINTVPTGGGSYSTTIKGYP